MKRWADGHWRGICYALDALLAVYCVLKVLDIRTSPEDYPDPAFQFWSYLLTPAFFAFVIWAADDPPA